MISAILSFLGGAGLSIINKLISVFERYQDRMAEVARHANDMDRLKVEHQFEMDMMGHREAYEALSRDHELDMGELDAAAGALAATYAHDASFGKTSTWVSDTRSLFRPFITTATGLAAFLLIWRLVGDEAIEVDAATLAIAVVDIFAGMIGWWFADRRVGDRLSSGLMSPG